MLLAGEKLGCLAEIMIIVAGMSIQDPRERPAEERDKADALHRRFWAPMAGSDEGAEPKADKDQRDKKDQGDKSATPDPDGSDFQAYLRLWDYLRSQQRSLSGNAFRRMCRQEYLHFLRIREWQDLHAQLRDIARDLKLQRNAAPAPIERVHTAILTGLLSQVGLAEIKEETGQGPAEAARPSTAARVHRGPRHPVRDQPRLLAGPYPTAAGDGRRDRGDHPAVGADGRSGRAPPRWRRSART